MKTEEFLVLINQLNTAYRGRYGLEKQNEITIYYEALNDVKFENLKKAIASCIKNEEYFPSIATIRKYVALTSYCDWSIQWLGVLNNEPPYSLNLAAQYALKIMDRGYVNNLIYNGKSGQLIKQFQELYNKYIFHEHAYIKENNLEEHFEYKSPISFLEINEERFANLRDVDRSQLVMMGIINEGNQTLDLTSATEGHLKILKEAGILTNIK